jgi:hypothetical protein
MQQRRTHRRRPTDLIRPRRDQLRLLKRRLQVLNRLQRIRPCPRTKRRFLHFHRPEMHNQSTPERSMASFLRRPRPHPIVHAEEVLPVHDHGVISIREPFDVLPVYRGSTIPTAGMCRQRIGEGSRWHGEKGWRKWSRRPFGKDGVSRLEVEWRFNGRFLRRRVLGVGCGHAVGYQMPRRRVAAAKEER